MLRHFNLLLALLYISTQTFAQKNEDWYNKDLKTDNVFGVSVEKVYETYGERNSSEIIVAIIDSGVDTEHEDLKENIWVNKDEIPDNGIDDDNNGYIDDMHGWNFLGGAKGNVVQETYETTRLYKKLMSKFDGKSEADVKAEEKDEYELYVETKKITEEKLAGSRKTKEKLDQFQQTLAIVASILEPILMDKEINEENVKAITAKNERVLAAKDYMLNLYKEGFSMEDFKEYKEYIDTRVLYHYNINYEGRNVVGDNPDDQFEKFYGNNNVYAGHADHGTHVAGIVGAVRNNSIGIDGVASNVKLMVLRAVPDGDERDKDVANSIIYAVDNGARIINMSFGKGHSPAKDAVELAVKYAEENNVLIVHAAGNSSSNIDEIIHYPSRFYGDALTSTVEAKNWIEVGASNRDKNLELTATFSNYGFKNVHLFAPGVDIYSTVPESKYEENSGTSMAAPVVSGVAALVLSYYPHLTAVELKEILMESSVDLKKMKVYIPGQHEAKKKTKFKKLSITGGVVNAFEAMKLAEEKSKGYSGDKLTLNQKP